MTQPASPLCRTMASRSVREALACINRGRMLQLNDFKCLTTQVAEYLRAFMKSKNGLLFATRNGTPYLYNGLQQRWLTPRLQAMQIDEKGMGFHASGRFRKTWLRGERCQEDINNFWMGHQPDTMLRCPNSILVSSLSWSVTSRKMRISALDLRFQPQKLIQMLQIAPSAPKAPRFQNNRLSNWCCNFSRINE